MAPAHIDLVYRKVGASHIFASKGIRGLVHVGDTDLRSAYNEVLDALGFHVTNTYGVHAKYVSEVDFSDIERRISEGSPRLLMQARLEKEDCVAA